MLKSIVTDIESVPEAAREHYAETTDGRFILDVEAVDGLELQEVSGLKAALSSERQGQRDAIAALRAAETRLDTFGDLDPAAAREALARIAAGPATDIESAVTARVEALRAGIADAAGAETRAARSELDAARATLARREDQLQRASRDNVIRSELERVRPLEDATDALLLMAVQHVRMLEDDGELVARVVDRKGEPRLDAKGKPMSVRAFMLEMREQRPALFKAPETRGMGTSPANTDVARGVTGAGDPANPWSKAGWNITRQVMLNARDPVTAGRLRSEAGV